ncbi:FliM/FliN family flagellar motor C-terminal domain-containing protein [Paracoccus sp. (in: a-proteobacteria)]|uniref:FliM/FliN family flagellar motor switch protein n=1 Tax=Paracoccus sp. TaxID=267 RepID=UPI003A8B69BF
MNNPVRDDDTGVLRRLLRARNRADTGSGRAPQLPQLPPPTPARAAATAIGRIANRLYHLPVQPVSVAPGAMTLAELPELLPASGLLIVLQGPGEALGVIALCAETMTSLIEIQTLGRITARPAERRKLTRADALICSEFVNTLMAELDAELVPLDGFEGLSGFRYATWLDDPRPLALMLEDKPYRSIDFRLRLGGAETRDSQILLALPQDIPVPAPRPDKDDKPREGEVRPARNEAATEARPDMPAAASLAHAIQTAPVELVGILCRRRITLGEIRALVPGQVLSLPRASLTEARIETPGGQLIARGKFGEAEGCHAIRLHDPRLAAQNPVSAAGYEPPIDDLADRDAFRDPAADEKGDAVVGIAAAKAANRN